MILLPRIVLLVLFSLSPELVLAADLCAVKDKSFQSFLAKFGGIRVFQEVRMVLPLVARYGDYRFGPVEVKLLDAKSVRLLEFPVFRGKREMKKDDVRQETLLLTKRYAEVYQSKDHLESDSDRILFKFRNISGCWYLEEFHEKSL